MSKSISKTPFSFSVLIAVIFFSVCFSITASADPGKSKIFKGCYKVLRGHYAIAKATFAISGMESPRVIGEYRMVIAKPHKKNKHGKRKHHVLSGPLLGHPYEQVDGGFITRHIMGTFNRIGTISSNEDKFTINQAGCPDANGNPQYAEATEDMFFETANGTGAFQNIKSGYISWQGIVNGCDTPDNSIGDFDVTEGELCFD
jgi:hypothetical protein